MVVSGLSYNSYQFIYIVFFLFNGTGYFWNEVKLIRQLCSIQSLNPALFWPDPFSVSSIVFRPLFPALTPCSPRTLFLTIKPRHFIFHWWFTFTRGFVCASILILFSLKLILILKPVSDIIVKLTHTHTQLTFCMQSRSCLCACSSANPPESDRQNKGAGSMPGAGRPDQRRPLALRFCKNTQYKVI